MLAAKLRVRDLSISQQVPKQQFLTIRRAA
jgi:hypothetical protein